MARKSPTVVNPTAPTPPQPPSNEGFVTPKQLAERLHVTVSTIWEWTRRRSKNPIPHYPVSRKVVYYKWSAVEKWIEAQKAA
jgi:predicted DNA-binding transcriptional regulator AlpA